MQDAFGLAGRARCVEEEERVFGVHALWSDVGGVLRSFFMPPVVSTLGPGHICACSFIHEAVGDIRALLEGFIHNLLGPNDLTTTLPLVCGDDDLGVGVNDSVSQRAGGETCEHHGVHGADTGDGEERDDRFGNHRQVECNSVTFSDAHLPQSICDARYFAQKLSVGEDAALAWLVCFIDHSRFIWVLDSMAVNAVVAGIEATLQEPGIVAVRESAGVGCLEVLVPVEQLACELTPELIGLFNRLFVHRPVFIEVLYVGLSGTFLKKRLGHTATELVSPRQ